MGRSLWSLGADRPECDTAHAPETHRTRPHDLPDGLLRAARRANLDGVPTPEFILQLREQIGHRDLWLSGATATVVRQVAGRPAEVLLVRRSDDSSWTPICGIVEPGELPSQTVVREAAEEACVQIEVVRLTRMAVSGTIEYPNRDRCNYLDHDFLCRWVAGEPRVGDDESTDARFFPLDALPPLRPRHARRIEVALAGGPDVVIEHDPH